MTLLEADIEAFLDRFAPYVGAEESPADVSGDAPDIEDVAADADATLEADVEDATPDPASNVEEVVPDVEEVIPDAAPDVEEVPVTPARRQLRALLRS